MLWIPGRYLLTGSTKSNKSADRESEPEPETQNPDGAIQKSGINRLRPTESPTSVYVRLTPEAHFKFS